MNTCIDCDDPYALASFWRKVLDIPMDPEDSPGADETGFDGGLGRSLLLLKVPEPKTVKNRVHLCLEPGQSRAAEVDLRRQFSNSSPAAKSLVKRLLQRVRKTGQVRTDPKFEDARGPNVRELRCVQRRLSRPEVEALLADYEAGGRVGELARVYGIHRTTVSAHVARAGKTCGRLMEAQIDEAIRLYEQGWSLRAVGRHLDVADKSIRRMLGRRAVAVRPRGRVTPAALAS